FTVQLRGACYLVGEPECHLSHGERRWFRQHLGGVTFSRSWSSKHLLIREIAADLILRHYLPVLFLDGFVVATAILMIALSAVTMRPRPTPEKQIPYESGVTPLGTARERFSVKFYIVAMLFIVFDIETVFLLPWGAHFRVLSCKV